MLEKFIEIVIRDRDSVSSYQCRGEIRLDLRDINIWMPAGVADKVINCLTRELERLKEDREHRRAKGD